ncbi:four and a half LIM domains protein limpet isoform X3 [Musca autumnalis]|uniref:four and a half LIM domains protein limpet isoform X3 n=1 Tax=Musca autumnalis TaxID=221902 RepID=UPI003CFB6F8B
MRSKAINVAVAEPSLPTATQQQKHIYAFSEDIKCGDINVNLCDDNQVQPIFIRKQPKFPTRERHLAIRRKKSYLANMNLTPCNNGHGCNISAANGCTNLKCEKKTCQSCKCPREAHAIYQQQSTSVHERLGFKVVSPADSGVDPRDLGYTWVPQGIRVSSRINRYFEQLPLEKVPKIGSEGARYREQQISYQLPKQDLSLEHCKHLEDVHEASYEDFVTARNEIALDIGYIKDAPYDEHCAHCEGEINVGDMVVAAPKFVESVMWHPRCFTCNTCNELLVDLTYCVHDDKIYCERHYAELLKPRCAGCDELIFSGEYTKAMDKDWHSGHFCCWQCDESLTGQRYVIRDDHPYCIKCYENVFANTCEECNKIIGIDSKDLSYKDKHWHEACFLCFKCHLSLVDKQFGAKADKIYCGNCYDAQFASRCDGCGEVFRAGTKKMEYKTRQWHENCFCCCVCKTAIGTKSFIPREQEIYCAGCYEEKFATRCIKCNKVITSGGVTYKNEPWHRECFTCTHCNITLAGQRFTSRDEKPYCAECFGELFAKRCTSCVKPITGIGGTRFISFENRHWHHDCFVCASCKTSLVGRGFITDGPDIICPECAKQKLM